MIEKKLDRELESPTISEKKLFVLQLLTDELKKFLSGQDQESQSAAQRAFLLFLKRFIDCISAIRLLKTEDFDRQAWMVSRHALECSVYMGALASMPEFCHAIMVQESFQRISIRKELAKSGLITQEERRQWDQANLKEIEQWLPELDALRRRIRAIKVDRGWPRSRTARDLDLADLALCSELHDIFPTLQRFLSPSVHVFFGNLVDDHALEIEGDQMIRDTNDLSNPSHDAVVMIGAVTTQIDKLFETELHQSTESLLGKHWPASPDTASDGEM